MATFVGELTAKDAAAAEQIEEILHQELYGVERNRIEFELNGDVDARSFTLGCNDPLLQKLIPYLAEGWINICDDDWFAGEHDLDWNFERCEFDPEKRVWVCRTGINFFEMKDILSDEDCAALRTILGRNGSPTASRIAKQLFEGNVRTIKPEPEQTTKRISIEVTETFDVNPVSVEISSEDYEKLRKHFDTDEIPAVADAMSRLRKQVLEHPESRRIECRIMDGEDCMLSRERIESLKS